MKSAMKRPGRTTCSSSSRGLAATLALVLGGALGPWAATVADETVTADPPSGAAALATPSVSYLGREDVREWIRETSEARGLDRHRVAGLFARLERREDILSKIATPAERTLTWREYRPIFLGEERAADHRGRGANLGPTEAPEQHANDEGLCPVRERRRSWPLRWRRGGARRVTQRVGGRWRYQLRRLLWRRRRRDCHSQSGPDEVLQLLLEVLAVTAVPVEDFG